jgi:hypothetical protein
MATKRKTRRKPMTTGKKIALGLIIGGAGFLSWKYIIKPILKPEQPEPAPGGGGSGTVDQQTTNVIDQVQNLPVNQKPKLTAIGTPGQRQDWGVNLKYGDKGGEIETLQKLINRIYQAKRSAKRIKVDGVYGNETLKARQELFDKSKPVNLKLAFDTYKRIEKQTGVKPAAPADDLGSIPMKNPLLPFDLPGIPLF